MSRKRLIILSSGIAFFAVAAWLVHRQLGSTSTGQTVNAAIDNLAAVGMRLLEIPISLLLVGAATFGALIAVVIARLGTPSGRVTALRVALPAFAAMVILGLSFSLDRRMRLMQTEVRSLRDQLRSQRMDQLDTAKPATNLPASESVLARRAPTADDTRHAPVAVASKRTVPMIDADKVNRAFTSYFGRTTIRPVIYDQATDLVEVRVANPPIVFYMAIVDLRTPGLEVQLAGTTTGKTFTSDFARNTNATLAINGEAGNSPQLDSGFGPWYGNFIIKGQTLITERANNKRPYLSFDKQNHATFTAMAATNRAVGAQPYNVIFGRMDALIDNAVQTANERDRQPRTAMGIDKDGNRLFLLVVDGRQQQYSLGFTRAEVGATLQAFGAYNGMLCDEGGSSCLYAKNLGGIVNSPSDGEERATYTHFGITLK